MINKIKSSTELAILVFIMFLFIIGVGSYGILKLDMISKRSDELYADRLLPIDQLGDVRYYASTIPFTIQKVKTGQISYYNALERIKGAQDSILFNWNAYILTYLTPEEKIMALKASNYIKTSNISIEKTKEILKNENSEALNTIANNELYPSISQVLKEVDSLLNLQVKIAQKIHDENVEMYNSSLRKFIALLAAAFALIIPFSYYLIRKSGLLAKKFNLNKEKLSQTEQNYRNVIEFAGEAIIITDKNSNIIDFNTLACDLWGYTREEFLHKKFTELIPAREFKKRQEALENSKQNKLSIHNRTILRKDGTEIETEISSSLMKNEGFFSIIRDITARTSAEQALKDSEEKYRYLFDNSPVNVLILDLETLKVLHVNQMVLEKFGYSKEEWSKMTAFDYRPEEDHQKIRDIADYLLTTDTAPVVRTNLRYLKKNGEAIIMDISSHKIIYDNKPAVMVIGLDVTEQKKAENLLSEREDQLNLFVEHSPAALAMFDTDMRYLVTSKRWITDYNLTDTNIIGKTHYEVFPEIGDEWKAIHQRCLKGAIESRDEDSFVRTDGSTEWMKWEIRPWNKADGTIGGIIMFTEVITERKKATEIFQKQFENAPDQILYVNKGFKIEAINKVISSEMTKEDVIGKDCIDALPEESRDLARESLNKCFATGENIEIENALKYGRWARSRFIPIKNNGEVLHVMIFVTDLTKQKQAEQKLIQSEEKYRALTENISDGIVLIDKNFMIQYHSASAERITGFSLEEIKGQNLMNFFHPDELARANKFYTEVLNNPSVPMQNVFRTINKAGELVWFEGTSLNLLDNDSISAIVINFRDVTGRKLFEEQQALMASIVNTSEDAIISKTLNGIITSWNKGAEKVLGYKAEETIGKHISMLIPLELRGEEVGILKEVGLGNFIDHYNTKRMKKNGEIIDVSLTISPIRNASGEVIGASKIMRDVTQNIKYEKDLIKYNDDLKKANTELDRFVYSASHDLRAPLKSMLGLITLTKEEVEMGELNAEADKNELIERFSMLNQSVEKLDGFIEDILNYSKNARMEMQYESIDFRQLIDETISNLKYIDGKHDLKLNLEIDSTEKFVSDKKRLSIILNNFLSNAYKYRDVNKEQSFVNITFTCNNVNAKIIIEDNGIGIVEKDKQKIFDMFYRSTVLSTGSGIGLYIVKETIEKMGGKIRVESELNIGTKFTIEIPNNLT